MTQESVLETDTQQLVENLAEGACMELFAAYGVSVERVERAQGPEVGAITGIVGFTGVGITGMVLLTSSEAPLAASNPSGGSLRDWVGELTNQLAGRLKHKLIAQGVEVYITTPVVLRAMRVEPMPRRTIEPRSLQAAGGVISLWCEVDVSPSFQPSVPGEIPVAEGEALLF